MSSISKRTYVIVSKLTKDTAVEYVQKRNGSSAHPSERYEKYCHAKTIGEALELGSQVEDFLGDVEHGLLKAAGIDRRTGDSSGKKIKGSRRKRLQIDEGEEGLAVECFQGKEKFKA